MAACDDVTDAARVLRAVNCVYWDGDQVVGDNTDGDGFVRGLEADLGVSVAGLHCAIVGAGGAAGAIAHRLGTSGASRVTVINRTPAKAKAVVALAGDVGAVGEIGDLAAADVVVNATPLGMADTEHAAEMPFDVALLGAETVVADLIYHPLETPLVAAARQRGLLAQNGLPMLVHQAVAQFEHWTGQPAPVAAMAAAVPSAHSPEAN